MAQVQSRLKGKTQIKIVKIFIPGNSSILNDSLHSVFAPWLEESYHTDGLESGKEANDEKGRGNNSSIDHKTA
jgi:hypothetical protein